MPLSNKPVAMEVCIWLSVLNLVVVACVMRFSLCEGSISIFLHRKLKWPLQQYLALECGINLMHTRLTSILDSFPVVRTLYRRPCTVSFADCRRRQSPRIMNDRTSLVSSGWWFESSPSAATLSISTVLRTTSPTYNHGNMRLSGACQTKTLGLIDVKLHIINYVGDFIKFAENVLNCGLGVTTQICETYADITFTYFFSTVFYHSIFVRQPCICFAFIFYL